MQKTDWRLPEARGWEVGSMGERDQEVQTSIYKINKL